jgi:anaerobic magnesium-protoporphyrin IX monomethyl ester cyclase
MKVMLLFPPNWTPTMPHLALPTLTAYLRQHGVKVIQRDLNVELFDAILTRDYLRGSVERLRSEYGPAIHHRRPPPAPAPKPELIQWALRNGPQLAAQVDGAKRVIRSDAFFDGPTGVRAFQTIADCLQLASLPFFPASLTLQSYEAAEPVDSSRALLHAVRDPQHNMFLDLYRRILLEDLVREQPDIVGISIPSMPQMLAGMTLGYLIKEAGLSAHQHVARAIAQNARHLSPL